MRQRSKVWEKLAARGNFMLETKLRIAGTDYNKISAPVISRPLMPSPMSVGNCSAASMQVSILTDDDIPESSSVVVMGRLTNGKTVSEWKEFGTFFIDYRDTSYEGLTTISCYDAMLKGNQTFITGYDGENDWPKTMIEIVENIAERLGVGIDPRTKIRTGAAYMVTYPETESMIQVLGYIGACHGGNWIITEDNLLRLVPLITAPDETFHILSSDYERLKTVENDILCHKLQTEYNAVMPAPAGTTPDTSYPVTHYITDETGARLVTTDGYYLIWAEDGSVDAVNGCINIPIVCGELNHGKKVVITGVDITDENSTHYTAGTEDGAVLKFENNPYIAQQICNDLFEQYEGLVYMPYTAKNACYDPATELGDQIKIGDITSVMLSAMLTLDIGFHANISAPNSDELSKEYPYLSEKKKLLNLITSVRTLREYTRVQLQQTADSLLAEITRATQAEGTLSAQIQLTAERLASEISRAQDEEEELSSLLEQTAESLLLKVSKGNVSSELSMESGGIDIRANRLSIDSTNFKLSKNGDVIATNFSASGTMKSINSSGVGTEMSNGELVFYKNNSKVGSITGVTQSQGGSGKFYDVVHFGTNAYGITFGTEGGWYFCFNNGLLPSIPAEFVAWCESYFWDMATFDNNIEVNGYAYFDSHIEVDSYATFKNYIQLSQGSYYTRMFMTGDESTACFQNGVYINNDLVVIGAKNRVVDTEHYGSVALNAVESAAALFSDMGSGVIDESGICEIVFNPKFIETIDSHSDFYVMTTQTSPGRIEYTEKGNMQFTVYGQPGTTFDWQIHCKQKGYSDVYLDSKSIPNVRPTDNIDDSAMDYLSNYEKEVENNGN